MALLMSLCMARVSLSKKGISEKVSISAKLVSEPAEMVMSMTSALIKRMASSSLANCLANFNSHSTVGSFFDQLTKMNESFVPGVTSLTNMLALKRYSDFYRRGKLRVEVH